MHRVVLAPFLALLTSSFSPTRAACDRNLARLEGYTIVKASSIRGTFNGCEFDRLVEFDDGTTVRCAAYGYQYAYHPDAVIFAKAVEYDGKKMTLAKMMVEGEMYDVRSVNVR